MKKLIIIFLFLISLNSAFATPIECAQYSFKGQIISYENKYFLALHEQSSSEQKFEIDPKLQALKYLENESISALIKMKKITNGSFVVYDVQKIAPIFNSKLKPQDEITFLSKIECK